MDALVQKLAVAYKAKKLNKTAHDEIRKWLSKPEFSEFVPRLREDIIHENWKQLMDKFYRVVIFGTGGIRGTMDIGTNRINNYTIRWASQAYAQYLKKYYPTRLSRGIAIAYDSRNNSEQFMRETARVLAANNINVHIFKYYRATPELSFTVRYLGLLGGIVITASHNPPEFNGYKVYDEHGVQVLPESGLKIENQFKTVNNIVVMPFDLAIKQGKILYINDSVDAAFAKSARSVSVYKGRDVKIVYSPLHGVGSQSVLPVLKSIGFKDIIEVEEQMSLDGNFPNVEGNFPNPEFPVVYKESIAIAKRSKADIVIVSDPDADRLGFAAPDAMGKWRSLSGNEGAALMGYFYMNALNESGKLPASPVVIKTSVTSELVRDVAESFGAEVIGDLLVGFKFIGERAENLPKDKKFIFGCEESVGYLFSNDYRDKGAETPAIVAAELGAWCKSKGITPLDLLETIYKKYGYYAERLYYREIEGFGSFEQMNMAMAKLRKNLPKAIASKKVVKIIDRLNGKLRDGQTGKLLETRKWDRGDMLTFFFTDDERKAIHVRPSGTEPKMKYYTSIKGDLAKKTKEEIESEAKQIEQDMVKTFEKILSTTHVNVFD